MRYLAKQHPDGRWGIYHELQLLATVGCGYTCKEVLSCLEGKNKKRPKRIDLLKITSRQTKKQSA